MPSHVTIIPRISVVINTSNEENNLPFALRSVRTWADELVVVDMYSEDRTVEIARQFGAKVYFYDRLGFADPARAFAVAQATGDWILMLDADELVPFPLSRKLKEVARSNGADIVQVHWINYLLGAPVSYTGWGPHQDMHMRFFRRGFLEVTGSIHNFLKPLPGARILDIPYQPGLAIVHFNYVDSTHFLDKLNRYTSIEARQAQQRGERVSEVRALIRALREFWWRYIRARGYRDGWRGFYLSLFMVFYRLATYAKLAELETVGSRPQIDAHYRREAERILQDYGEGGGKERVESPEAQLS